MPEPFRINESGAVCRMYVDPTQWNIQPKQQRAPQEVNGYLLSYVIGSGAYSKVRLAIQRGTGQKVAVKIIRKQHECAEFTDKFLPRELKVLHKMRGFSHPNLIKIHELFTIMDKVYVVMDYARGGDLLSFLNKFGPVYEWRAKKMYHQVLSALDYCHSRNIVHRDLKCENILLDKDNNVKLTDFGFATNFNGTKLLETYCGSFAYAPPEILRQQKYNGYKADIWSSGVVLYAMVCGILPFGDNQLHRLIDRKEVTLQFKSPHNLSAECKNYIKSILKREPYKRPTVKQLLTATWLQWEDQDASMKSNAAGDNNSRASSPAGSSDASSCWSLLAEASLLSVGSDISCKKEIKSTAVETTNLVTTEAPTDCATGMSSPPPKTDRPKHKSQKKKKTGPSSSKVKLPACVPRPVPKVQYITVQPAKSNTTCLNTFPQKKKGVNDILQIMPVKPSEPRQKLKAPPKKVADTAKLEPLKKESCIMRKKTFVIPTTLSIGCSSSSYCSKKADPFDKYILQGIPVPTSKKGATSVKARGTGIDPSGAPINLFRPKTKLSLKRPVITPFTYKKPRPTPNNQMPAIVKTTTINPKALGGTKDNSFLLNMLNNFG